MGRCSEDDKDVLRTRKIAAIGPATKKALAQFDISAVYQPEKSVAEALVEQFPGYPNLKGVAILWPRTNIGRNLVAEKLQLAGAAVEIIDTYRTSLPDDAQDSASLLQQYICSDRETILTVASSQSVRNLTVLLQRGFSIADGDAAKLAQVLQTTAIISIGPQTTATAVECLGRCDRQADEYNMDGLVKAVCEYVARSSGENSWQH
jgi:uroporphyrinogen-III synthase